MSQTIILIGKLLFVFIIQAIFLTIYRVVVGSLLNKSNNNYEGLYEKFSFFRVIDSYLIALICLAIMRSVFQEYSVISTFLSIANIYSTIVHNDPVKVHLAKTRGIDPLSTFYEYINSKLKKYVFFTVLCLILMLYIQFLRLPIIYDVIKLISSKIYYLICGFF